jgi:hypothetical protein
VTTFTRAFAQQEPPPAPALTHPGSATPLQGEHEGPPRSVSQSVVPCHAMPQWTSALDGISHALPWCARPLQHRREASGAPAPLYTAPADGMGE